MLPDRIAEGARIKIIQAAEAWIGTPYLYGGGSKKGIDCSRFVWRIFTQVVDQHFPYMDTELLHTTIFFFDVPTPDKADIVLWDGHVAIVVNPLAGDFIGAQSKHGVSKSNYKTDCYWKKRPGLMFRQFQGPWPKFY